LTNGAQEDPEEKQKTYFLLCPPGEGKSDQAGSA